MVTFYPTRPVARADAAARGLREASGLTLMDPDDLTAWAHAALRPAPSCAAPDGAESVILPN